MTYRRLVCLPLLFGLVAGCGKPPAAERPAQVADSAPPAAGEPDAQGSPTRAAAPVVAPVELATLTYDEVTTTRAGEVAFNATEHVLKVAHGDQTTYYSTGAMTPRLAPADQQRLLSALAETFRYPAERTRGIEGTFAKELGGAGNELVTVTFQTSDSLATAAELYDGRLSRSPTPVYRVAVPLGDSQVVTYVVGMGAQRYRVVLAPEDGGTRVAVTQSYLAGAPAVEFMNGQGVLKSASGAES